MPGHARYFFNLNLRFEPHNKTAVHGAAGLLCGTLRKVSSCGTTTWRINIRCCVQHIAGCIQSRLALPEWQSRSCEWIWFGGYLIVDVREAVTLDLSVTKALGHYDCYIEVLLKR